VGEKNNFSVIYGGVNYARSGLILPSLRAFSITARLSPMSPTATATQSVTKPRIASSATPSFHYAEGDVLPDAAHSGAAQVYGVGDPVEPVLYEGDVRRLQRHVAPHRHADVRPRPRGRVHYLLIVG